MADRERRKLSAKQILSDIRSGVDRAELKRKYGLSDKSLQSVRRQLLDKGLLTEQEFARLNPPVAESPPETSRAVPNLPRWRCPACQTAQPSTMSECPACGVVVAKFLARGGHGYGDTRPPGGATGREASGGSSGWSYVAASIAVLALVGGALVWWSHIRSDQKAKTAALTVQKYQSSQRTQAQPPGRKSHENTTESADALDVTEESATEPPYDGGSVEPVQKPVGQSAEYTTGTLRKFTSADFKREVVEASKTYPVIFQFYSDS